MIRKVYILQHRLLHYRTKLFQLLKEKLLAENVELVLMHGHASEREKIRKDEGSLPWAKTVVNSYMPAGSVELCWQWLPSEIQNSDLIVLMQENRLISNYPYIFGKNSTGARIAYWGHGRNLQSRNPDGLREKWKKYLINKVDWWFAYTELTKKYLIDMGYENDRITNLNNAIDNNAFSLDLSSIRDSDISAEKLNIGIEDIENIGLYCGSLWEAKNLDLLLSSFTMIQAAVPDFVLLIVGDGPDRDKVRELSCREKSVIWVGAKTGVDKALYYRMSKVILNPGAVGLHILDSFVSGKPMVTTDNALHGPEIAYLKHAVNGYTTDSDPVAYAKAVIDLLLDENSYRVMVEQLKQDAKRYTLEKMVDNFSGGIMQCLNLPKNN